MVEAAMLALVVTEGPVDVRFPLTVEATRAATPRRSLVTPLRDTVAAAAATTLHLIVVIVSVLLRLVAASLTMVGLVEPARGPLLPVVLLP
jgi:hypothetical protein